MHPDPAVTLLRPRLRGLVVKLALFYALLSLPTLMLVEAVILTHEFQRTMQGLAEGSLERAATAGATDLEQRRPWLQAADAEGIATTQVWLDAWALRLQSLQ